MVKHLILYHSVNGQTEKICRTVMHDMEKQHLSCTLCTITDLPEIQLPHYTSVLLGLPVRYGRHPRLLQQWIRDNLALLKIMPTGLFSVNLTARKFNKNCPKTNPYLRKLLRRLDWKPHCLAVFAGALKYPDYSRWDRLMVRLIMKITQGPTNTRQYSEFTQWDNVQQFAEQYIRHIKHMTQTAKEHQAHQ